MKEITSAQSYRIQVLRGFSIIAVVLIHNTPNGIYQVWCKPFINFAVGMFLFISGLLSTVDKWNPKKRVLKVFIPYAFWTFIYVVIKIIPDFSRIPIDFVKDLITARSAAVMYYVFVYVEFTLLIPLIDKLAKSKLKWVGFVISPLEIIVMRLLPLICHYEINNHISIIMRISCLG